MKNQTLPSITRILFLLTLLCAAVASVPSVHASTITVQNTGDGAANAANCPGSGCRLRDALAKASGDATIDTIDFSVTTPGTITLSSGQLEVNANVMIDGPGADMLAVDANHTSRVFHINSGKTVTISGLTITNGTASGKGGGIYNDHATLTVSDCTVSGNSAAGFSGGGGVHNEAFNGTATLTISNSTFSGNSAGNGGAIGNNGGNGTATLTIKNTTLSGNSASNDGGGIFNFAAFVTIGDTILKTGASGVNIASFNGPVTSLGYNLSNDGGGGFLTATGDQINTDPMLGPLRNNGGLTFTHGLLAGSPALDQGKNFSGATTDQRGAGFPRTVDDPSITNASGGDGTDIGSFEGVQPVVCPQPQGYWKNNPDAWPVNSLTLGSQSYTKSELLNILKTPIGKGPKADASLILADQLIAAKLNIANGSDPAPISSTITHADSLLSAFGGNKLPYKVKPSSATGQMMVNDATVLSNYNNGALTAGCGG